MRTDWTGLGSEEKRNRVNRPLTLCHLTPNLTRHQIILFSGPPFLVVLSHTYHAMSPSLNTSFQTIAHPLYTHSLQSSLLFVTTIQIVLLSLSCLSLRKCSPPFFLLSVASCSLCSFLPRLSQLSSIQTSSRSIHLNIPPCNVHTHTYTRTTTYLIRRMSNQTKQRLVATKLNCKKKKKVKRHVSSRLATYAPPHFELALIYHR